MNVSSERLRDELARAYERGRIERGDADEYARRTIWRIRNGRPTSKKVDESVFGDQANLCRRLPCCACGDSPPSDPHHTISVAAGGKDEDTVPLCRFCHNYGHAKGWKTFERVFDIDLKAIARELRA